MRLARRALWSSYFPMQKGYFDDLTELNTEGHALQKPKLRPGGADMSDECKNTDRLLTKRQERLEEDLDKLRGQFEPKMITVADIDGENPFQTTFAEPPKFFKAGANVQIDNPGRPDSGFLACLKEEGNKWELCEQKELSEDGNDFQCDEKRSENFHWKEGDTVKFLGTCIEPKALKKTLLKAETGYLPCVYPDGNIPGEAEPAEGAEGAERAEGEAAEGETVPEEAPP